MHEVSSKEPVAVLTVRNLQVDFPVAGHFFHAVNRVSFDIHAGEVLGMIGESGAGKSMTGSAITRLLDAPGYVAGGEIYLKGQRIDNLPDKELAALRGKNIGTVFQDPLSSLNPLYTIGRQLIETIRRHLFLPQSAARKRAIELLTEVGILDAERRLDAYPHEFSGGMRQRVVIALAIAADPELLIADEPTSALDVSVQAQIVALLKKLCVERGLAVLLITHDMGVVAEIADRVVVLHHGRAVEAGSVRDVIQTPREDYTRKLIAATPSIYQKNLRNRSQSSAEEILRVENLAHDFRIGSSGFFFWKHGKGQNKFRAVNDVSFHIREGETYALVGESGSGKSTIARIVAGLLPLGEGQVRVNGADRSDKAFAGHNGAVQMIFQDPYASLNPHWRVGDIIAEPIRRLKLERDPLVVKARVSDLLDKVKLPQDSVHRYPHEFSGGQRQRIAIARALASRPRFIICDEPTSALDVSVQAQVLNLMTSLQAEFNLTYLLISHNLAVVRQMADRVGILRHGVLVEQGEVEGIFENPTHAYTKMLINAVPDVHEALARRNLS
ncbi:dipeptide ABC transporter ATP-binding protein [Brucella gallinifaecis]|uniref:ABC transporter ATP-binding protein n=1 Tax=Brucella gallinifaecis TaxID=215590 RepID=A0A502BI69_9HYPH|nr:ABC transporter ATP-binding protein [Brucella gallinifaecis]TPF73884.1 ABC transporter ATP-binding protein [Brucella gallinifaecis]